MTHKKLSHKIFAWFFICLMLAQSTVAYGNPLTINKEAIDALTTNNSPLTINKVGLIGAFADKQIDNPADNYFRVWADKAIDANSQVYLVYELEGISHFSGVARCINDHLSTGGYWVQFDSNSSEQREQINPANITQGYNTVQFNLPEGADFGYKVKNVRFEIDNTSKQSSNVVYIALENGNNLYIKGFVNPNVKSIKIGGTSIETLNGNFETELSTQSKDITISMADGSVQTEKLVAKQLADIDRIYPLVPFGNSKSGLFKTDKDNELALDGTALQAEGKNLKADKEFSVTTLRYTDLPAMDMGMSNLTKSSKGYRFLPHGEHFTDSGAVVTIAYDKLSLPSGYTEKDINAYYFDQTTGHWASLQKDSIDTEKGIIYARTTHFTDMIAGVIKAPESPETAGFAPTMMTGIKAADPTGKIQLIAPPQANNRGTAGTSYGFEMPPARNGMSPSVALSYNSDGGSGWAGVGWDLQIPSISVETRWGVPRYNSELETETYLMDGQMIGFKDGDEIHLPHRHKEKANRESDRRFYPRKEGSFAKIIRHGNSVGDYTWEVTGKDGTVYEYGGNGGVLKSTITDIEGNTREVISEWKLSKVTEVHGDYMEYFYEQADEAVRGSLSAKALYLKSIKNNTGTEVVFTSNSIKTKKTNNARYGFLSSSNKLLDKVDVKFEGDVLRSYTLEYKDGVFHTKLLDKITHLDNNGDEFASHTFDYYDDVESGGTYKPFSDAVSYDVPEDRLSGDDIMNWAKTNAVGGSKTRSWGAGSYVGFGWNANIIEKAKSLGVDYDYNQNTTEGLMTLVDIDGDGLADRVFAKGGELRFRRRIAGREQLFSDRVEVVGGNINTFSFTKGKSNTFGVQLHVVKNTTFGGSTSISSSKTSVYFTDANSDGLIDIVRNGKVYFNRIVNGVPHFQSGSSHTPSPILAGETLSDALNFSTYTEEEIAKLKEQNPLNDAVRVWHVPDSGNISINAPVRLLENLESEAESPDGVRVFIQHNGKNLWQQDIAYNQHQTITPQINSIISVKKGDRLYFRVHSLDNGYDDKVQWGPEITYVGESTTLTDPNGKAYYRYSASQDFLLTGNYGLVPTMDGNANIESEFKKPITSDDVEVRILKESGTGQEELWSSVYAWDADTVDVINLEDLSLSTEDKLTFKVSSSSNIDWQAIDWKPYLYYTESSDGQEVMDENGKSYVDDYPIVQYGTYNQQVQIGKIFSYKQELKDSSLQILPLPTKTYGELDGTAWLTVKKQAELIAKKQLVFQKGILTNNDTMTLENYAGDTLYLEVFAENNELATHLSNQLSLRIDGKDSFAEPSVYSLVSDETKLQQGPLYRAWGQFSYNANLEDRASQPMDESKLNLESEFDIDEDSEANEIDNIEGDSMDDLQGSLGYDATKSTFIMMRPNMEQGYWQGYDQAVFVSADSQSASRMGDKEIASIDSRPMQDGEVVAPSKKNKTFTYSASLGGKVKGVLGLNASGSKSESRLISDYMDMNGDGYPDVLAGEGIQYTATTGGLSSETQTNGRISYSETWTEGTSVSGRPILLFSEKVQKKHENKTLNNLNGSVGATHTHTTDSYTYIDVNGDGLPDKAFEEGKVSLNMGYSFTEAIDWDFEQVQKTAITDISTSGGVAGSPISGGLSVDAETGDITGGSFQFTHPKEDADFQAGLGFSHSRSQPDITFIDINSDGLPDWTTRDGDVIKVRLNTGNGFDDEIRLNSVNRVSESLSLNGSANIAFTGGIPIPIPPPPAPPKFKIVFNPRTNLSRSVSRDERQLKDIDGDGNLDFVVSHRADKVKVYKSTIARTNKLKSVQNPLGGSFTLDYKRSPATYDHPGGKWVMASLEINDGVNDDGANSITEFDYADGVRDRYEREFLGFGKVITKQIDSENSMALYRSVEQDYDVSSYYTAGNSLGSTLKDADNNIYTQSSQEYYTYRVKSNGDSYTFSNAGDIGILESPAIFTPLQFSQSENKEGGNNSAILQQSHYTYRNGATGELSSYKFSDKGSLSADGSGGFNYQTSITYTDLA
ncbi:MAG: SpvB/TcaC N-terminal domain-containing protein, partial [Bacteroidales bacterium]